MWYWVKYHVEIREGIDGSDPVFSFSRRHAGLRIENRTVTAVDLVSTPLAFVAFPTTSTRVPGRQSGVWKVRALADVEDLWPSREGTKDVLSFEVRSKMHPIGQPYNRQGK